MWWFCNSCHQYKNVGLNIRWWFTVESPHNTCAPMLQPQNSHSCELNPYSVIQTDIQKYFIILFLERKFISLNFVLQSLSYLQDQNEKGKMCSYKRTYIIVPMLIVGFVSVCVMTSCYLVHAHQHLEGTFCVHIPI